MTAFPPRHRGLPLQPPPLVIWGLDGLLPQTKTNNPRILLLLLRATVKHETVKQVKNETVKCVPGSEEALDSTTTTATTTPCDRETCVLK
jgi:hypothetical protein